MKSFRVNHVPWCAPEGLAALVRARSLFEEGRYARGLQITLSPKNVILKNGGK